MRKEERKELWVREWEARLYTRRGSGGRRERNGDIGSEERRENGVMGEGVGSTVAYENRKWGKREEPGCTYSIIAMFTVY